MAAMSSSPSLEGDLLGVLEQLTSTQREAIWKGVIGEEDATVVASGEATPERLLDVVRELGIELLLDQLTAPTLTAMAAQWQCAADNETSEVVEPGKEHLMAVESWLKTRGLRLALPQLDAPLLRQFSEEVGIKSAAPLASATMIGMIEAEAVLLGTEGLFDLQDPELLVELARTVVPGATASLTDSHREEEGKREVIDGLMTQIFRLSPSMLPRSNSSSVRLNRANSTTGAVVRALPLVVAHSENATTNVQDQPKQAWTQLESSELPGLKVGQLREFLKQAGLETKGLKQELVSRLSDALRSYHKSIKSKSKSKSKSESHHHHRSRKHVKMIQATADPTLLKKKRRV
jgi:hypothetical protein